MSYVVLKCGSVARGDANQHSDIDFVCLHSDQILHINDLKRLYNGISFLSLESIRLMKLKGSLFLAHLDVDGYVVEGDASLLSSISGFRPHPAALETAINATSSFIAGIEWFPGSHLGALWLHDVLYVSLRNIVYCSNAINSIYRFGLLEAMESFGLSSEEMNLMFQVRQGKYAFRSMQPTSIGGTTDVNIDALASLAAVVLRVPILFRSGGQTEWARRWSYDYWDERIIERAIINHEVPDGGFRELLNDHNYNRRILPEVVRKYVAVAKHIHTTNSECCTD